MSRESNLRKAVLKHYTLKPRPPNQKLHSYKCNYCPQIYVCHTTRMCEHLLECKGCPPHIKTSLKEKQKTKGRKSKKRKLSSHHSSQSSSESENEHHTADSTSNQQKKVVTKPEKISQFFDTVSKS